jgi:hypothetical protein
MENQVYFFRWQTMDHPKSSAKEVNTSLAYSTFPLLKEVDATASFRLSVVYIVNGICFIGILVFNTRLPEAGNFHKAYRPHFPDRFPGLAHKGFIHQRSASSFFLQTTASD